MKKSYRSEPRNNNAEDSNAMQSLTSKIGTVAKPFLSKVRISNQSFTSKLKDLYYLSGNYQGNSFSSSRQRINTTAGSPAVSRHAGQFDSAAEHVCAQYLVDYNCCRKELLAECGYEWLATRILIPRIAPLCSKSEMISGQTRRTMCKQIIDSIEQYITITDCKLSQYVIEKQWADYNYRCRELSETDAITHDEGRMKQAVKYAKKMLLEANNFYELTLQLIKGLKEEVEWETFQTIMKKHRLSVYFREDVNKSDNCYFQDYVGGYKDCSYPAIYYNDKILVKGGTE